MIINMQKIHMPRDKDWREMSLEKNVQGGISGTLPY